VRDERPPRLDLDQLGAFLGSVELPASVEILDSSVNDITASGKAAML